MDAKIDKIKKLSKTLLFPSSALVHHYLFFIKMIFKLMNLINDRSQCFKSHGMFDFAYKLQLLYNIYNIYRLVFTIWMVKIIKMKIPLGSCKLYTKRNI